MKALITIKLSDVEIKNLQDLGYELILKKEEDLSYSEELKNIDIMFCYKAFDSLDISLLPKLKWIQLASVGVNQVPIDKVLEQGITITNNKGGFSIPIAEWITLKLLEMVKNSKEFYGKQNEKAWKTDNSLLELYGKTVGFVGTGSIAGEAAKRLEAFGMNIIGLNSSGRSVKHFKKIYSVDKINEFIKHCDFVVIAVPYTEKTHHIINASVFDNMKDGTYLVNIARGSIIDEEALIENLRNGKIKKAALDVFEVEPLPKDSPLWDMDNVIITSHNSWGSEMNHKRRFDKFYENMKRFINDDELLNVVDLSRGY